MKSGRNLRCSGFSLIEIMIVVVIIGLLAAVGVPAMTKMQRASMVTRFASDLRVISGALQQYSMEHGTWPEDSPAALPPHFAEYMSVSVPLAPTPVGGAWAWQTNHQGFQGVLTVVNSTAPAVVMTNIDQRVDDGNLETGHFRGAGATYFMVIEP